MTPTGSPLFASIRPGERLALAYFFTLLFLVGVGLSIGGGVANTLFLKRFGIEHLPWVFLVQGAGLAAASLFYASVSDRLRPERILGFVLALMVILLLALWGMAHTALASWAHPPLYLLQEIVAEILALHFSLYICSHFDNEQAKRLMPLAMAGSQLGELTGGLILALAGPWVGPVNMVWAWVVSGVLAWVIIRIWHHRHGPTPRRIAVRTSGGMRQTVRQLRQGLGFTWQQRNSVLAVFFTVIVLFMLSFLVNDALVREFSSENELAMVFGLITFVGGSIAFVLQIAMTGQLIARFGVRSVNLVFPLTSLAALAVFITPFGLTAALLGSFNRRVLLPVVRNPARALMLQALPDYIQGRMRGISLAIVLPLAMILAGLLIKGLHNNVQAIAGLGLALGLLALYFAIRTNQDYLRTIVETLKERLYVPRDDLGPMDPRHDAKFMAQLLAGMDSQDEAMRESFARMLVSHFGPEAVPFVLQRIPSASHPCQDRLSRLVAPYLDSTHMASWMNGLAACDMHGRATLLAVAFQARWSLGLVHVLPSLEAGNPRLVACGIIGALRYDDAALRERGLSSLRGLLESSDARQMIAAMTALTAVPLPEYRQSVCRALTGEPAQLRLHALRALHALGQSIDDEETVATIGNLYRTEWSWPLREACVRVSALLPAPRRIAALIAALDDPQPQVQKLAIELLQAQGANRVATPLLQSVRGWQLGVRGQISALSVLGEMLPPTELRGMSLAYLDRAAQYREWLAVVEARMKKADLLRVVLRERITQLTDLGLRALAWGSERALTAVLRVAMVNDNRRQRMLCIELIEDVADAQIRGLLQRLLEPVPAVSGWAPEKILSALASGPDAWMAQCAQQGEAV